MHSHQKSTADVIAKYVDLLQASVEQHLKEREQLVAGQLQLKDEMNAMELAFADKLVQKATEAAHEATIAREKLEAEALALSIAFDHRSARDREEAENQRAAEAAQLEEERTLQLSDVRKLHEKQIAELKRWFRDVTSSNSSTIESLKVGKGVRTRTSRHPG